MKTHLDYAFMHLQKKAKDAEPYIFQTEGASQALFTTYKQSKYRCHIQSGKSFSVAVSHFLKMIRLFQQVVDRSHYCILENSFLFVNSQSIISAIMKSLNGVGKRTILFKLFKMGVGGQIEPVFFQNEYEAREIKVTSKLRFFVGSLDGSEGCREFIRKYKPTALAIIFVIDSTDRSRIALIRQEIYSLFTDKQELSQIKGEKSTISFSRTPLSPLLIFANKEDISGAMSAVEIAKLLDLESLSHFCKWFVQPLCAFTGEGLWEGLEWLNNTLK
ncbi:9615_t:CDS:2 [Ambispora leptoticha]|uniref:9615_t:CDS:1 n=1 Tax=Ambispora leptoticha TaxID=144679 RepID=A0A9N9CGP5_9GLOM|nr:9615_t:CDS:2 [Ambispora leptoticha]